MLRPRNAQKRIADTAVVEPRWLADPGGQLLQFVDVVVDGAAVHAVSEQSHGFDLKRAWDVGDEIGVVGNRGPVFEPVRDVVLAVARGSEFAERVPYNVIVVELEEGPFFHSNLIGCENSEIRVGMPVEVVFDKLDGDITLPRFRLRSDR